MKKEIEKIKKEWQRVGMTELEKSQVLERVFEKPVLSPYFHFTYFSRTVSAALCIALLAVSSSAAYKAESSLPGELLYPLKIYVTEPVRNVVNTEPEERAAWAEAKAVRRLDEVGALIEREGLDRLKLEEVERKFTSHKKEFDAAVSSVASSSKESAQQINSKFRENVKGRSKKIKEKLEENERVERGDDNDENKSRNESVGKFLREVEKDLE